MILCTDSKNGIGKDGSIPWHSSDDFKHFKAETTGFKILMGYKTWESLPNKPLKDRVNIVVINRTISSVTIGEHKDVVFIHENFLAEFMRMNDGIIVIGGAKIYEKTLSYVDEVILSEVSGDFECDTFFNIHDACDEYLFHPTSIKLLDDGTVVSYLYREHFTDFEMIRNV